MKGRVVVWSIIIFALGFAAQPLAVKLDEYLNPRISVPRNDITNLCFTYHVLTKEKRAFAPLPWWETNCRVMY